MSNKIIDLFCGCGGLSKGFEMAGFESVLAIDFWKDAIETYNNNHKSKVAICDDVSDNIKGIKGLGEKILFKNFEEFKKRKVTLEEVIEKAKKINENRILEKKKPLKWAENIVNKVTDGCQGEKIYEINEKIIDLKNPLMTDEAKELIESIMYAPIDPTDRNMENLYNIIIKYDIDNLKDSTTFGNFFSEFMYIIDKEKKNLLV